MTLLASDTRVRILDQQTQLASHRRTYDTGQTVEDPAHLEGLLAATRQANVHTVRDRLRAAVPGEAMRPRATRLLALLDDYGAQELAAAANYSCRSPEAAIGRPRGRPAERVTLPVFLMEDGLVTDLQVRSIAREADGRQDAGGGRSGGGGERAGGAQVAERAVALPSTTKV